MTSNTSISSYPESEIFVPSNWQYIQEGNENIVLGYIGINSKLNNLILRLTKTGNKEDIVKDPIKIKIFKDIIVTSLIGEDYLPFNLFLQPTIGFIKSIDDQIYLSRPQFRRNKRLNWNAKYIFLSQNLLMIYKSIPLRKGNTLGIEIKPKWGFLPTSRYILEQNKIKLTKCRFCLHQEFKLLSGNKTKSEYCPMDLYSQNIDKIKCSLSQLIQTPQNNLRLFRDGIEIEVKEAFDLLSLDFNISSEVNIKQFFICLISVILLNDKLLYKLKLAQLKLDKYDIEGIYQLKEKLENKQIEEPIEKDWLNVIESLNNNNELNKNINLTDDNDILTAIYAFIASLSFKDCSILLTIPLISNDSINFDSNLLKNIDKEMFRDELILKDWLKNKDKIYYQLGIVDLDPKSHMKLDHYYQLDQNIVKANIK
ncbi:hypothetical protein K502DRAFT_333071 [Neoconidiobolus thromboides FSU 785]|nr:hypothetical protein K502DRAFT_333071 [Neoconidiobolus thromboides FSU 785]